MILLDDYAMAIIRIGQQYYCFDSHSRDECGMLHEAGTSTFVNIGRSLQSVSDFILRLSKSLNLKMTSQFEMVGVSDQSSPAYCDNSHFRFAILSNTSASPGKHKYCMLL